MPVDEVVRVLELFDTRYGLHRQALPREAGRRARLRAQLQLGAPDLAGTWAHAGCAPARRAPAQASAPCASRHDAAPGRLAPRVGAGPPVGPDRDHGRRHQRDLLGVDEEGTMSSFRALSEVIRERGLFCSLYADRASHYWHTPEAGGTVDKDKPTQVGRALQQLDIESRPIRPRPGGAPSACSGPCRNACPRNSGSPASPRWPQGQPLPQGGLPAAPQRPLRNPGRGQGLRLRALRRRARRHPLRAAGAHRRQRQHRALPRPEPADPTRPPATTTSRQGSGCTSIQTEPSPSSTAPDAWPATTPTASPSTAKPGRPRDPLRRSPPVPCGQVDSRSAPDHFPTGPTTSTEAVHLVHKPVNSKCSRQTGRSKLGMLPVSQ